MNKYRFGKYVMPCLLWTALAGTIAAIFAPYAVEILLGLAVLCLAVFALCYIRAACGRLVWSDYIALLAIVLSILLTLLMILTGHLQLYTGIVGLNLLVILGISVALLYRKNASQASVYAMILLCLAVLGYGAYSHIAYGRTIMATIAERVLESRKVPDGKAADAFQRLAESGEAVIAVKTNDFDRKAEWKDFEGMPVLYVNGDASYEQVIFYIHGGYYVYQMSSSQTATNSLTLRLDCIIVKPSNTDKK